MFDCKNAPSGELQINYLENYILAEKIFRPHILVVFQ